MNYFQKNNEWTLFLDRDGVINQKLPGDYVKNWEEFEFLAGVLEALTLFNKIFRHIFIVTNQQGIGKGLMKIQELNDLHTLMLEKITNNGGRIDKIFFCPDLANSGSLYRKPNIGMALQARKEFKDVNLKKAVMAGDSISDMKFGKKAGMKTVFISSDPDVIRKYYTFIDYAFPNLLSFAQSLTIS